MKYYYLDAHHERASAYILRMLAIELNSLHPSTPSMELTKAQKDDYTNEHDANVAISYELLAGEFSIDCRDSVDAWIRIELVPGDRISLPVGCYRRFFVSTVDSIVKEFSPHAWTTMKRFPVIADSISIPVKNEYRELVCELCYQFFLAGWVTGTGGSNSIRYGGRIYMTPSGVQKERIKPDELYVLDTDGSILATPHQKPSKRWESNRYEKQEIIIFYFTLFRSAPKLSDCSPLFLHAYKQRNAGKILKVLIHLFLMSLISP